MDRNTLGILMGAPFQYLLVTVNVVSLEKVDFSETQSPKAGS